MAALTETHFTGGLCCRITAICIIVFTIFIHDTAHGQQQRQQQQRAPVAVPTQETNQLPIKWLVPSLPVRHYQYWLRNHPRVFENFEEICKIVNGGAMQIKTLEQFRELHVNLSFEDPEYLNNFGYGQSILDEICGFIEKVIYSCWGYENNCSLIYMMPKCTKTADTFEKRLNWFNQADFGYLYKERLQNKKFCSPDRNPSNSVESALDCTKHFKSCRGENLYVKFDSQSVDKIASDPDNFVFERDQIGGWNCDLQRWDIPKEKPPREGYGFWHNELKHFTKLSTKFEEVCDMVIERPAFFMKIGDTATNMYKQFANLINLYNTIHLYNRFQRDNQIIFWDNKTIRGKYDPMWSAFSKNPPMSLDSFRDKRVCFRKFITTLTSPKLGEYFCEKPLMKGCMRTGLFHSFNRHILHRLKVPQITLPEIKDKIDRDLTVVTILTRAGKPHRRILNEDRLRAAIMEQSRGYNVRILDESKTSFHNMTYQMQYTDILVGAHSTQLTYSLVLPDFAALIELKANQDTSYEDLARMRGVEYFDLNKSAMKLVPTDNEDELEILTRARILDNPDFSNYEIQVDEFLAALFKATERVKTNRIQFYEEAVARPAHWRSEKVIPITKQQPPDATTVAPQPVEETTTVAPTEATVIPTVATITSTEAPKPLKSEVSKKEGLRPEKEKPRDDL